VITTRCRGRHHDKAAKGPPPEETAQSWNDTRRTLRTPQAVLAGAHPQLGQKVESPADRSHALTPGEAQSASIIAANPGGSVPPRCHTGQPAFQSGSRLYTGGLSRRGAQARFLRSGASWTWRRDVVERWVDRSRRRNRPLSVEECTREFAGGCRSARLDHRENHHLNPSSNASKLSCLEPSPGAVRQELRRRRGSESVRDYILTAATAK